MNSDKETPPCMIMDDAELELNARRLDWRRDNSFQLRGLFRPVRSSMEFPRPFQTYRATNTSSSASQLTHATAEHENTISSSGPTEFPFQRGHPNKTYADVVAGGTKHKWENTFRPLVDLSSNVILTPESIAEFGVPLLVIEPPTIPEDDDPPYAAVTPTEEIETRNQTWELSKMSMEEDS